jgi:hypothetical protein
MALVDSPPEGACDAAATPVIFPDGRVMACVGPLIDLPAAHPLVFGNLRERPAEEIFDEAERNVLVQFLRTWGPAFLLELLRRIPSPPELPRDFVPDSICALCYSLLDSAELREALEACMADESIRHEVESARARLLGEGPET